MGFKVSWTFIKSFTLGFLPFFLAVIVADIYGGAGVVNLYYVGAFLLCLTSALKCITRRTVPIELILYFLFIVYTEFRNGQGSLYYYLGLLKMVSVALVAAYLSTSRRIFYFLEGLAISLALACIYFLLFATNDVIKVIDSELRHALPFFSVSHAGLMTALGYFLGLVYYMARKEIKWLLLSLLSLAACLYTLSKNALLAIVIITVVYMFIAGVIRMSKKFWIALGVVVIVVLSSGRMLRPIITLFSESIDMNNAYGIISVAGRGSIWLFCIQAIPDSFLFGYGYYSSSQLLMERLGEEVTQAHNCLLQSLLSTGIIGTVFLAVYCVRVLVFIIKNRRLIMCYTHLRWMLCILMYFVIRSMTEGSFAQCLSMDVYWFFLCSLLMMGFVKRRKLLLKRRIGFHENPSGQSLPVS